MLGVIGRKELTSGLQKSQLRYVRHPLGSPCWEGGGQYTTQDNHGTVYVLWTKPGKMRFALKRPHNTAS